MILTIEAPHRGSRYATLTSMALGQTGIDQISAILVSMILGVHAIIKENHPFNSGSAANQAC